MGEKLSNVKANIQKCVIQIYLINIMAHEIDHKHINYYIYIFRIICI